MNPARAQPAAAPAESPRAASPAPTACGLPISEAVADAAADWLTALMAGDLSAHDRHRFEQWRRAHPDHDRAWRHIEVVRGRLQVLQPTAAYQALSPFAPHGGAGPAGTKARARRSVLRALFWAGAVGTTGLLATRTPTWQQVAADHRSATGERRRIEASDGSVITLNTASAIDLRFDGAQRLVRLVAGEILVATSDAATGRPDPRPFIVETAQGRVRALGTRFAVRQQDDQTLVTVLQSAVEITPFDAATPPRMLQAGEQARFTRQGVDAPTPASAHTDAWARGQIVADEMRLADFVAELARYRRGLLRCAPEVAELRLSGVFPLPDTERILETLPSVLPVQVSQRTHYWVTVEAPPP